MYEILSLSPQAFAQCGNIWNMKRQKALASQFFCELCDGRRITYVCRVEEAFVGEISLVFRTDDPLCTIRGQRAYVSHLIVKKEYRRRGIGRALISHALTQAKQLHLQELTVSVDVDNFPALQLYVDMGFNRILHVGKDDAGQFLTLMKTL